MGTGVNPRTVERVAAYMVSHPGATIRSAAADLDLALGTIHRCVHEAGLRRVVYWELPHLDTVVPGCYPSGVQANHPKEDS